MNSLKLILLSLIVVILPVTVYSARAVTSLQPVDGMMNLADSLYLPEVVVSAKAHKEIIPAQKLSGNELKGLNSLSIADAIRYFSGVQIKDYGGIGGLKTVDIRSMGSNHMGVFYDGIELGNAQNGQIDLGKYSLDNLESVTLYNGQKSEIFQSARDFGSSGSIYLRTRYPRFENDKNYNLRGILRSGSFGLINPSLLWEQKLSSSLSATFNTEWISANGKYAYRYKRIHPVTHELVYDTTATRENGDMNALRLEGGLHGFVPSGNWNLKAYFYSSERGIPGAIVNNVWKRSQRQWDKNFFTQGSFRKSISPRYDILVNAKYAHDRMRYLNPDTTLMYIDNSFTQQEAYLSLVNKFALLSNWDISLAADWQWNGLQSDIDGFREPTRYNTLIAAATAADFDKVTLQGSILSSWVIESVAGNKQKRSVQEQLSPALFLNYKPLDSHNLNIRAFYKQSFRMPTFNDLYYTDIGNADLDPEESYQYNLGAAYDKSFRQLVIRHWEIKADAYLNRVTNKIIAVPKGNGMYRWMMTNLGQAEIKGVDLSASAILEVHREWLLNLRITYTYQQARDLTRRPNKELEKITYGGQIAYIPWHNGSLVAGLQYRLWQLNYSFIYICYNYLRG